MPALRRRAAADDALWMRLRWIKASGCAFRPRGC